MRHELRVDADEHVFPDFVPVRGKYQDGLA